MVKAGTLDKHGRKIEGVTPAAWDKSYVDYSAQGEEVRGELIAVSPCPRLMSELLMTASLTFLLPALEQTQPSAPAPAAEEKMEVDAPAAPAAEEAPAAETKEEKKETKEEKAARKAAKAEKKRSRDAEGEDVSRRTSRLPRTSEPKLTWLAFPALPDAEEGEEEQEEQDGLIASFLTHCFRLLLLSPTFSLIPPHLL
jgi:H/ACA ribonucleoprotein complex subunit 4